MLRTSRLVVRIPDCPRTVFSVDIAVLPRGSKCLTALRHSIVGKVYFRPAKQLEWLQQEGVVSVIRNFGRAIW
ncbi:hypothetical protein D3C85_1774070 [compost metagenome]